MLRNNLIGKFLVGYATSSCCVFSLIVIIISLIFCVVISAVGIMFFGQVDVDYKFNTGQSVSKGEEVIATALEMAANLKDCRDMKEPLALINGCSEGLPRYAAYSEYFPSNVLEYGHELCGGALCTTWRSGNFQCVSFILGAYSSIRDRGELAFKGNAGDWWISYEQLVMQGNTDYQLVIAGEGRWGDRASRQSDGYPISPGDIMVWLKPGTYGHVSIVLNWQTPSVEQAGSITFVQANAWKPIETLPFNYDGTVDTANGYWDGYQVKGYIHPIWLPSMQNKENSVDASVHMPDSPYVEIARSAAKNEGIDENIFLRQIKQESNFNPSATSSAGAIGIAQFMPETAADLGVDPYDPIASLKASARLMAQYVRQYGAYDKALAAYNAGPGGVAKAIAMCASASRNWRDCLPSETQEYIRNILLEK